MTHKNLFLTILFFLVTATGVLAQTGSIKGSVLDSKTKESLIGAAVIIQGTTIGAAADLNGDYTIQNVAPGTYTLVASSVAYQSIIKKGVVVETKRLL